MNAFDMSPRDFQLYLDERGYTGDQRDDLLRRYRRANSPFAGIFDFIEGLRGGDEEAGLRRGEIAPMVFPEGMSGFEAFTTGQARPAVPGFLLGGAEAAASAVDAPSAAAAGLIPAQDAAMEALGTAGFAMGAGGAAVRPAGSVGMGGRVADALPSPRNEAEAMAKQVLEMRAAGRAGDVTEEMMAAADPQYMFAHTPLPMDEASRMARAAASGRNPEFHGTTTGSDMTYADAFRGSGSRRGIGFVTSDNPYVASSYADPEFGAVFPLLNAPLPPEAPRIDVGGNVWSDISVETPVRLGDRVITARQLSAEPADAGGVLSTNQLSRGASFDYPGIEFSNILDRSIHAPRPRTDDGMEIMKRFQRLASEPSTVTMRQDTRGVRSRFARFDPEFAHLRNLSAANADKSTGLLAAAVAATDGTPSLPPLSNAQRTQIAGTLPTYQKAADILGTSGPGLDYGAGLGLGARELGFDAFEPFPREGFVPTYTDPAAIPSQAYDRLTNFNVLNVVPREVRDDIVENIGRVIAPGGRGLITTRGRDVLAAKGTPGPEPMSLITSRDTYQKGFLQQELQDYLRYILGSDFEVNPLRLGPAGAEIRRITSTPRARPAGLLTQ